jgi:hypothetical protein
LTGRGPWGIRSPDSVTLMQGWQTRLLILVTIAGQALSCLWIGQPVFFAHCHEECGDEHAESDCDPASCLALFEHEHDDHLAAPGTNHHCHCHHFHLRGEANRFERGRFGEVVRKHRSTPAAPPGSPESGPVLVAAAVLPTPDPTAAPPPPQRLLAIRSTRLLV